MIPANHERYLLSRFRQIEGSLAEAIGALEPADGERLFRRVSPDATAAQRKILREHLAQVRFTLRRFMEAHQIQEVTQPVSGLWSLRTAVLFAQIAAVECGPQHMRGYGELDAEATTASLRLVAELTAVLRRLNDYLDKGDPADLAARLAQLDATRDEIQLLAELERITTAHGLVELRAPLQSLIERAAAPRYEIAVLGRVSAGKSSLLNWWLGQPVLPAGVTPVTAVPTQIVHGPTPRARVRTPSGRPADVPLEQLATYITESGNPANSRGVLEVQVELPSERLAQGIRLVDTPGVGSLATAGAAQTWDYLPRCDLAILLIEAAGTVTREDLDLARAVLMSGSDLLIVLSKADRLDEAQLAEVQTYVDGQLQAAIGQALSVHPISTLPQSESSVARWFEEVLAPKLARHREAAAIQLRRKIGALRETVVAVLSARLTAGSAPHAVDSADQTLAGRLAQLRSDLEGQRSKLLDLTARIRSRADLLTERAAEALVRCWLRGGGADIPEHLTTALAGRAATLGDLVADLLQQSRQQLQDALPDELAEGRELPQPRGRPLYDTSSLPVLAPGTPPWWTSWSRALLMGVARSRVEKGLAAAAAAQLSLHADALRLWGSRYLDELSGQFDEAWALQEGGMRLRADTPPAGRVATAVSCDLELLRHWPHRAAASEPLDAASCG